MELHENIGQHVTLHGTAKNAKAGAVVVTERNQVIYIGGLYDWPYEYLDKRILAKGMLMRGKLVPDPVVGSDGGISTGAFGDDYILEGAEYSVEE